VTVSPVTDTRPACPEAPDTTATQPEGVKVPALEAASVTVQEEAALEGRGTSTPKFMPRKADMPSMDDTVAESESAPGVLTPPVLSSAVAVMLQVLVPEVGEATRTAVEPMVKVAEVDETPVVLNLKVKPVGVVVTVVAPDTGVTVKAEAVTVGEPVDWTSVTATVFAHPNCPTDDDPT
jgi:hypothetical protein